MAGPGRLHLRGDRGRNRGDRGLGAKGHRRRGAAAERDPQRACRRAGDDCRGHVGIANQAAGAGCRCKGRRRHAGWVRHRGIECGGHEVRYAVHHGQHIARIRGVHRQVREIFRDGVLRVIERRIEQRQIEGAAGNGRIVIDIHLHGIAGQAAEQRLKVQHVHRGRVLQHTLRPAYAAARPHHPRLAAAVEEELAHRIRHFRQRIEPAEGPFVIRIGEQMLRLADRTGLGNANEAAHRGADTDNGVHAARDLLKVNARIGNGHRHVSPPVLPARTCTCGEWSRQRPPSGGHHRVTGHHWR